MNSINDSSDDLCPSSQPPAVPPLDPTIAGASDRYFTSLKADAYRCVRPQERDMLTIAWGPRLDVIFDPKGAAGILGGRLRIMGRTAGAEVELASVPITSSDQAITVTAAGGCEEYVIKASLGTDPGLSAKRVESYFFARVYNGR